MHSPLQAHPQLKMKQLSSLSTLTYSKTPSPQLITEHNLKINLSRFQSVNITDKVKQKLNLKSITQRKRNQSVGSVLIKDYVNPQFLCHTTRDDNNFDKVNFHNVNLQQAQKQKANKFFSKLTGASRSINSSPKLLDLTLPVIDTKKTKKNSPNRANFMQLWLDEALDPQQQLNFDQIKQIQNQLQPEEIKRAKQIQPITNLQSIASSHLSTVRQYKIDRQYLRSQNVPREVIDRLYSTLYIYTYGIEKVFGDILSVVKSQQKQQQLQQKVIAVSQQSKRGGNNNSLLNGNNNSLLNGNNNKSINNKINNTNNNNKLLDTFWKSYIKLLQGCTSFQTVFQKVQQQHIQKISYLKQQITNRQQQFQQQRKSLSDKITKLQKQILLLQNTHTKLLSQHKISQSTLQLTDHAFNEEVQLRLKFEQKINHIYSSYEQLKVKYQSTVELLNLKMQEQINNKCHQLSSKQHIRRVQSKLEQTKHQLLQQRQKLHQRQQQIVIKRQQLKDIQQKYHHKLISQTQQYDHINIQVNQYKLLQTKYQQLNKKLSLAEYKYDMSQEKIKELSAMVDTKRQQCDQLHCKLSSTMKQLAEYQHSKITQQRQIYTLQRQLSITKQKLSFIEELKHSLQTNLQLTTTQLQQKNYQINTKTQAMQKITNTIQDLKASKQKYQRLFKIINSQKQKIEQEKNTIQSKYSQQKEQIIGLKMLQQNRQKHIKQIQLKHDKQKDILKRKITGYNEIVTKKESLILQYQKKQQQQGDKILDLNYRLERVEKQLDQAKNIIVRVQKKKLFLQQRLQDAKEQIQRLNKQLKQYGQRLRQNLTVLDIKQSQLSTIKYIMQMIKSQQNFSIRNLGLLYNEYKEVVNRKGQHVHPMVYEDLKQQFNRVVMGVVPGLRGEIAQGIQREEGLGRQISQLRRMIDDKDQQIVRLSNLIVDMQQQITKQSITLKQHQQLITTLNKTIQQQSLLITKYTQTLQINKQRLSSLNTLNKQSQQQLIQITKTLQSKQTEIHKLNANVIILSDRLLLTENQLNTRVKNNIQVNRVKEIEEENDRLRAQLDKYVNKKSVVQQQVQTQPQGQVVIQKNTINNNSTFTRRNKFTILESKPLDKQTQVALPPYDNIPLYIDNKISQIRNQSVQKQMLSNNNKSILETSKQQQQQHKDKGNNNMLLTKERSVQKIQLPKQLTRREELRRALRFTYMRR